MNLVFLFCAIFPYPSQLPSAFCIGNSGEQNPPVSGNFSWRLELRIKRKPSLLLLSPGSPSACFPIQMGVTTIPWNFLFSILLQDKLETLNVSEITSRLFYMGITSPPQPLSLSHPVTNLPYHRSTLGTPPLCPSDSGKPLCLLPGIHSKC